tara:strand:+ start:8605 stop:10002 length:1398 start_codon:yes stop_codon:yes gene_type:complete
MSENTNNAPKQATATVEFPATCDSNIFKARIEAGEDAGEVVPVVYCSPYGGWRTGESPAGGLVAFPEVRSKILITKPNEAESWFYLSTVMDSNTNAMTEEEGEDDREDKSPTSNIGGEDYKEQNPIMAHRGVPQRMAFQSVSGNGLILSDSHNNEVIDFFTQLHTPTHKKVSLYDTDKNDCIEMETQYHDRIKLTGEEVETAGAQELHIETESNQNYHSETGKIWMEVTEGLDIDIINNSGGASKIPVSEKEFGNINLISRNMDVNITTEGRKEFIGNGQGKVQDPSDIEPTGEEESDPMNEALGYSELTTYVDEDGEPIDPYDHATVPEQGGRIFIQALGDDRDNQMIQIYSKDKLMVYGEGEVYIKGNKVFIESEDKLDILAKKDISIRTPGDIKMQASKIHLNSGFSFSDPNIDAELRDNNLGVGVTAPTDKPIKLNPIPGQNSTLGIGSLIEGIHGTGDGN